MAPTSSSRPRSARSRRSSRVRRRRRALHRLPLARPGGGDRRHPARDRERPPDAAAEGRGPFPFAWAIRNGDSELGLTYHFMDAAFDTGNVLAQRPSRSTASDTEETLIREAEGGVAGAAAAVFAKLEAGDPGAPQGRRLPAPVRGATTRSSISASTAAAVHRQVRAWSFVPDRPRKPAGRSSSAAGPFASFVRASTEVEGAERLDCADGPLWIVESVTRQRRRQAAAGPLASASVRPRGHARRAGRRRRLRRDARGDRGLRRRRRRRRHLEAPPDPQPLGRGGGRHQRSARERGGGLAPRPTPSTRSRAPTTSATRTRSRSSRGEAPGDIYQLEHWGAFFSRREDGKLAQRPFGAAGSPRTVYAADITGHVLIQVLYEQLVKRDITVYEEYFAWKLVENDGRCQGVVVLGPPERRAAHGRAARRWCSRRAAQGRIYRTTTNAYACTGDGAAMALPPRRAAEGHGVHAVPPDDALSVGDPPDRGLPRRGRIPDQQRGRAVHEAVRAERDGARLARRRLALRADRDRQRARASTARSTSTCATSARRRSSSGCPARASSR